MKVSRGEYYLDIIDTKYTYSSYIWRQIFLCRYIRSASRMWGRFYTLCQKVAHVFVDIEAKTEGRFEQANDEFE
jgi:hypothetical protein